MDLGEINLHERMKHYHVSGLSIALINKGQINMSEGFGVLEAGTNKMVNKDSIFNACSISKFFTSMLVLKLTALGILDLDGDVNNSLITWKVPEYEFTPSKKVTLRSLLIHQSGVIDPKDSFSHLIENQTILAMGDLLSGTTRFCKEPIELKYIPGTDFQYSDAGFCIIQLLIEDVMGKAFEEVMSEHILKPLNLTNSMYAQQICKEDHGEFSCGHDKKGSVVDVKYPIYPYPAAAGLWTTPSDIATLVLELISSLKGESRINLPVELAKEIISPNGCKEWTGLGVFLDDTKPTLEITSLGWGIGFQSMMVAYPYLETGAIIMTNTDLGVHQSAGIIGEIIKSLGF
ncbi:penicillin-binding protein [Heyndrickxia sporothermodurans]|nr:penicillin-binding protein [Heyndrickxia sporothermodurans]